MKTILEYLKRRQKQDYTDISIEDISTAQDLADFLSANGYTEIEYKQKRGTIFYDYYMSDGKVYAKMHHSIDGSLRPKWIKSTDHSNLILIYNGRYDYCIAIAYSEGDDTLMKRYIVLDSTGFVRSETKVPERDLIGYVTA